MVSELKLDLLGACVCLPEWLADLGERKLELLELFLAHDLETGLELVSEYFARLLFSLGSPLEKTLSKTGPRCFAKCVDDLSAKVVGAVLHERASASTCLGSVLDEGSVAA